MIIRFRGVRGSYSQSLRPDQVKRKISSAVQRVKPGDIASAESREKFLRTLPQTVFGTVGGHTACVEVRLDNDELLIFDCGSGLRVLDDELRKSRKRPPMIHIFFSHFHYDHLTGFPFFSFLYDSEAKIRIYSPHDDVKKILERFMSKPYHPVGIESFIADIEYVKLEKEPLVLGESRIWWIKRKHPDECYAYAVEENGKKIIYSTDTELSEADFRRDPVKDRFFKKADAIILDGQYTLGESIEKYNWGHTSYSLSVDFALEHEIGKLFLFHHDPQYNDARLEAILRSSRWYCQRAARISPLEIYLAREDREVII